jgi:hypothetical protein
MARPVPMSELPTCPSFPLVRHSQLSVIPNCPSFPIVRHSRAGGNITRSSLDSRLRGNDLCMIHGAILGSWGFTHRLRPLDVWIEQFFHSSIYDLL